MRSDRYKGKYVFRRTPMESPLSTAFNESEWGSLAATSDGMDFVLGNGSDWNATEAGPPTDLYNYWAWSIIDGSLMILIVSGNTLTILAVTLSRRLSSLVSNQFVLNLAISDLMVGLTLPYHLVFYVDDDFGKIKWSCLMRFILIILACLASIYNIIAIAVDRYIAIVHPLHYSRYMTKLVTRLLMSATWSTAVCISCIPIFWNDWHEGAACEMNVVVLLVLGSFSLCWMPFVVVACAQTLPIVRLHNPIAYRLTSSLAMSNSGINPLIYAWKNAGFRAAFAKLLRCKRPDTSEYRGSPAPDRKRGSVALREGSISRTTPITGLTSFGGTPARLVYVDREPDTSRCRIIENAGYTECDRGDSNPSYAPEVPTPVHRPPPSPAPRTPDVV
ncbi:unnamed protein product [Leptidea sinapis]|uniref:G-protein coupled receptors family 1 profile domain-containing protein n=1 Tax=Leptidea sinapis TaxID=189913 RepID=A0A5E4QPN8_9NEOP|nr:unnamed protein product [Leptidea sinapis]